MQITVRLFAGLRELAGRGKLELELPDLAFVRDVWPALELGAEPAGLLHAVNRAYAERETELSDGDEVALIPPVSGGTFRLTEGPVQPDLRRRSGRGRAGRSDRHLFRHRPRPVARSEWIGRGS